MQAYKPRNSILTATPRLKIVTDMVANELYTIYDATKISILETKTSGLVVIISTSFLYAEDQ